MGVAGSFFEQQPYNFGKLDLFANNAKIIHFDIDPAEIGKNKIPNVSILGDIKRILQELLTTYKVKRIKYPNKIF